MSMTRRASLGSTSEVLVGQLQPHMQRVLAEFRIPQQDAEDLLQETLVALLFKWSSIKSPQAWTLATLRNRCVLYWKQREEEAALAVSLPKSLEALIEPLQPPQAEADLRHDFAAVLARLPKDYRAILRLRMLGCRNAEVAERLGWQADDVRHLTNLSLASLTRELHDAGLSL